MPTELQDGDILLVCIDPDEMETVDYLIRLGEQTQEMVSGSRPGALESHVMLYVDLRTSEEQNEFMSGKNKSQVRGLRPGMECAHLIHMEPAGLIGCPLYAFKKTEHEE